MHNDRFHINSLSAKIILLCGVIALLGMGGVIWMNSIREHNQAFYTAEAQMRSEGRLITENVESVLHTLREDTEIVALSPDVQLIADHFSGQFEETTDYITLQNALSTTSQLFMNVMERRPHVFHYA